MTEQEYLLTCLIEEAVEVGQKATKALRFGINEIQPGQDKDNIERLVGELNDLMGVVGLLVLRNHLPVNWFDKDAIAAKQDKVLHFMEYSKQMGTLRE